jgi:flagellar hook-basal body complex protein FliE
MKISQGLALLPNVANSKRSQIDGALKDSQVSFGETLHQAMKDVNHLQQEAGKAVQQMVSGESTDLHDVMIAVEKAKTSFELLMEVRNKTLEVYREIMRMQA